MNDIIEKQKLNRGRRTLKNVNESIDLARKFPLKNKGFIKPKEDGWFEAVGNKHIENTS